MYLADGDSSNNLSHPAQLASRTGDGTSAAQAFGEGHVPIPCSERRQRDQRDDQRDRPDHAARWRRSPEHQATTTLRPRSRITRGFFGVGPLVGHVLALQYRHERRRGQPPRRRGPLSRVDPPAGGLPRQGSAADARPIAPGLCPPLALRRALRRRPVGVIRRNFGPPGAVRREHGAWRAGRS